MSVEIVVRWVFSVLVTVLITIGILKHQGIFEPRQRIAVADYAGLLEAIPVGATKDEMKALVDSYSGKIDKVVALGYVVLDSNAVISSEGIPTVAFDASQLESLAEVVASRKASTEPNPRDGLVDEGEGWTSLLSDEYLDSLPKVRRR